MFEEDLDGVTSDEFLEKPTNVNLNQEFEIILTLERITHAFGVTFLSQNDYKRTCSSESNIYN